MTSTPSTLEDAGRGLKTKAIDRYSATVVEGALRALADPQNPLRLNFFSTAMRMLFEHVMDQLAPADQVTAASWFKPEQANGRPTRWQRAIFAIQGGLSEAFVRDTLHVDPTPLRRQLLGAIDELSKHVHGRADTIIRDPTEQDAVAMATVTAMTAFLDTLRGCRDAVLEPIAEALDEAAVDALLSETIMEVDELATHHSLDEVYVDAVRVAAIGAHTITYMASGSIDVTLQWGSNSDLRRCDGAELDQNFPFECEFELPLDDLWDLQLAEPAYRVDTSAWTDAMQSDEDDWMPISKEQNS
jgi:Predicted pPIWI-associating nuclease